MDRQKSYFSSSTKTQLYSAKLKQSWIGGSQAPNLFQGADQVNRWLHVPPTENFSLAESFASLRKTGQGSAFEQKQTLFAFAPEKKPLKLSKKITVLYPSERVRQRFVPALEIRDDLVKTMTAAAQENEQKTTIKSNNQQIDIVKIDPKWWEKKPTKTAKNKKWLDRIATAVIALAAIFSVAYLTPLLVFDVFNHDQMKTGKNADGTWRTEASVSAQSENGTVPAALNQAASTLLAQDLLTLEGQEGSINILTPEDQINDLAILSQVTNKGAVESKRYPTLPEIDESLPVGEWIKVDKIGLNGQIHSDENVEDALAKGVVMISGYGEIGDKDDKPVILAAHRFGYKWWWNNNYARLNSFYYLPELEVGDIVTVIKDQREWRYEIYDAYEGTAIDSYDADLILYTCRFLNSDVRYFRYARLIDPATY